MHFKPCHLLSASTGPVLIVAVPDEPRNWQKPLPLPKISIFQWPPLVLDRPLRIRSKSPTEDDGMAGKRTYTVTVNVWLDGTLCQPVFGTVTTELEPLKEQPGLKTPGALRPTCDS